MNDALNLFYYMVEKTYNFLFGAYYFQGVSIGMLGVVAFIFTVLLHYLLAVPHIKVATASRRK